MAQTINNIQHVTIEPTKDFIKVILNVEGTIGREPQVTYYNTQDITYIEKVVQGKDKYQVTTYLNNTSTFMQFTFTTSDASDRFIQFLIAKEEHEPLAATIVVKKHSGVDYIGTVQNVEI